MRAGEMRHLWPAPRHVVFDRGKIGRGGELAHGQSDAKAGGQDNDHQGPGAPVGYFPSVLPQGGHVSLRQICCSWCRRCEAARAHWQEAVPKSEPVQIVNSTIRDTGISTHRSRQTFVERGSV